MTTEKRGSLVGGAATEEALDSSASVLAPNRAGKNRGLQQYYTPARAAKWIASVLGRGSPVLDLTAGDGALLAPFPRGFRFGVEIDADQIESASDQGDGYAAVQGDVQRVYPILREIGIKFSAVALNPPFGLTWDVPGLGPGGSAALTVRMARSLLDVGGVGALICGADRFEREIRTLFDDRLYAVVRVESLFSGTALPCSIAFWREYDPYGESDILEATIASVDTLTEAMAEEVNKAEYARFGYRSRYCPWDEEKAADAVMTEAWVAIQQEHSRRLGEGRVRDHGVGLCGNKLRVALSPFSRISIANSERDALRWIEGFRGQPPEYFALRPREWARLETTCRDHSVEIEPALRAAVTAALTDAKRATCPLYPIAPAQRLAYLVDLDKITCRVDDPARGFAAGESYALKCETVVHRAQETRERQTLAGPEEYAVVVERKALEIHVGDEVFTESPEDMTYLLEHFEVPDPGDLASQHPREVAQWETALRQVEGEIQAREPGFRFRSFQVRDLARMLVKVADGLGGVLAWEMGLGKALAQGAVARALEIEGKLPDGCALFVMPQDLVGQFATEMKRFFGVDLLQVGSAGRALGDAPRKRGERTAVEVLEALRVRRADPTQPRVWAVTWFEALAIAGRKSEALPRAKVHPTREVVTKGVPAARHYDWETRGYVVEPEVKEVARWTWTTSASVCPRCRAVLGDGWDGEICTATLRGVGAIAEGRRYSAGLARADAARGPKVCGYTHRRTLRKPAYSVLKGAFDFVSVDEGTKIQGNDSLASKALRAFHPRFRVLCTGTPMKNYVHQMFWLLWWTLGDSTPRFPYGYDGGQEKFLSDFGVVEKAVDDWGKSNGRVKVLPEVSNLLYLWKMLCGSVIRRRMDEVGAVVGLDGAWTCPKCRAANRADVGEPWTKPARLECACGEVSDAAVPLIFHPTEVPWGVGQQRQYARWLNKSHFAEWFLRTHPTSPLQDHPEMVELLAASLGQLAKLEYGSTDPSGDADSVGSPWTPSRLRALQTIEAAVAGGKQVLYGSCLVAPGKWVADRLTEHGIRAAHLTEEDEDGKARTKGPRARSQIVADFRAGKTQVLCASLNSMALGHNLDVASVVVIEGLPWDFQTFDQFLKRARRLTSRRPVAVHVYLPHGSLTSRKWELLRRKTDSVDLALDGRISDRTEAQVDKAQVLAELIERGIRPDGSEIPESEVMAAWCGQKEEAA
jgi:hypothetical protein